jgi:hypothetical protein
VPEPVTVFLENVDTAAQTDKRTVAADNPITQLRAAEIEPVVGSSLLQTRLGSS